jgi:hypothetical protein
METSRIVRNEIWENPMVMEKMSPEDKYFYLYLLANSETTPIGIYKITIKQMAFDLGYSIDGVLLLLNRFIKHHKLIRYNTKTRELAIKHWGKYLPNDGGKPLRDCLSSELKDIDDHSLIFYVSESIHKQDIRSLYESFFEPPSTKVDGF